MLTGINCFLCVQINIKYNAMLHNFLHTQYNYDSRFRFFCSRWWYCLSYTSFKLCTMRRVWAAEKCIMTFYHDIFYHDILSVITTLLLPGRLGLLMAAWNSWSRFNARHQRLFYDQSYNENLANLCLPQIALLLDDFNWSYYKTIANNGNHPRKNVKVLDTC